MHLQVGSQQVCLMAAVEWGQVSACQRHVDCHDGDIEGWRGRLHGGVQTWQGGCIDPAHNVPSLEHKAQVPACMPA